MADGKLSPFVYWAQTESHITLKVDLKNVKSPEVHLESEELEFIAHGYGAKGQNEYHFVLEFFQPVDSKLSHFRVSDRQVDFSIKKQVDEIWPRLVEDKKKLAWLKVDFDKWKPEIDEEDEIENKPDIFKDYKDVYERLKDDDYTIGSMSREDLRRMYLFMYNLFQFIGFLYIMIVMSVRYSKDGPESMEGTYVAVGKPMRFVQMLQMMEIVHVALGYTRGKVRTTALQVLGRAVILFIMIEAEPRMQTKPIVFYLFVVWSTIEVVRYPYYMLKVYDKGFHFLTWLRYTIWIPLYPLGFFCEGVVILRNIPYFEETQKFTIKLPNPWNFSFDFTSVMRLYLLLLCFPLMYCMMTHMYRQRVNKLGPKSWKKKL